MFLLKRLVGFYQKKGGDIEKMNEKINEFPNLKSEKIVSEPEKMITVPEQINETIEKIPEKRRRGQRGADKKPRRYNSNSLQNLKPFRPTVNLPQSNSNKTNWKIIGITLGCAVITIGVTWVVYKKRNLNQ